MIPSHDAVSSSFKGDSGSGTHLADTTDADDMTGLH
jgi:hypothetical protein